MKSETSNQERFFPFTFHISHFTTWLVFASILFGLSGCGKEPLYQQQSYVFGTLVEISIYGEDEARAKQLAGQVLTDFDQMHEFLHAWKPGTLSRMNEIFLNAPARAAILPGMIPLLKDATRLSEESGGLFNPAIGNLVRLWGFHGDEFKPVQPDPAEIEKLLLANPKMADIVIEGIEFHSTNPAVRVDLGGYAKGYALDVAADYLRSQGVKNALINIGGNIIALGKHGKRSWQVGIQHPRKPGAIATLELRMARRSALPEIISATSSLKANATATSSTRAMVGLPRARRRLPC